jgi:uncharacterized membrane-anchored protein
MPRKLVVLLTGLAILAIVNYGIYRKEQLLAHGKPIFLEIVPVDPRSLMQGDYMALRFALAREVESNAQYRDGHLIVVLDDRGIARFSRHDDGSPLSPGESKILYRVRANGVAIGTNAFFFQEGKEPIYRSARYGEARLDADGQLLLTGLRDENLKLLGN